jgi:Rod binding domain-containing protein
MLSVQSSLPAASPSAADLSKTMKAGMQFEAILLNSLLGGLERAFTNLPGKKEDHSTEAYSGFAMQALASGLAESGGIGVGRLIAKALDRRSENTAPQTNDPNR